MLDFETCQRLKEAGFPQGDIPKLPPPSKSDDVCSDFVSVWRDLNGEWVLQVTIEDLLRELGENCQALARTKDGWAACPESIWYGNSTQGEKGDTPEQALANLYLALHPQEK